MATLSQYTFVPRPVDGSMTGASQVQPTGTDGHVYYEIIKGMSSQNSLGYVSGTGDGKRVGLIAYDFVQARWSCLWLVSGQILVKNGWLDDAGAIKDFMASLATPVTTAQNGDALPPPASIPEAMGG
jgi:hypothetical protein